MKDYRSFFGFSTAALHGKTMERYLKALNQSKPLSILQHGIIMERDAFLIHETVSKISPSYALFSSISSDNAVHEITALKQAETGLSDDSLKLDAIYVCQEGPTDLLPSLFLREGFEAAIKPEGTLLFIASFTDTKWVTLDSKQHEKFGFSLELLEKQDNESSKISFHVYRLKIDKANEQNEAAKTNKTKKPLSDEAKLITKFQESK
jgi:hypothetical protein